MSLWWLSGSSNKIHVNISKRRYLPFIEFLKVLYSFIAKVNLIFRKDLQNITKPIFLRRVTEFHFISFLFFLAWGEWNSPNSHDSYGKWRILGSVYSLLSFVADINGNCNGKFIRFHTWNIRHSQTELLELMSVEIYPCFKIVFQQILFFKPTKCYRSF